MRGRSVWAAAVLWAPLLAGCAGEGGDAPGAADPDGEAVDFLLAPAWAVGDWWRYTVGENTITWIVTGDDGVDWFLDTDHPDWAFWHQAMNQISTLGKVAKADLAGSQEHGRVDFFAFPLALGKTWSLEWDGSPWDAEVTDLRDGRAEVTALAPAGERRVYVYDNATGWFDTMHAFDRDGTQMFSIDLQASGSAYAGTYVRWDLPARYDFDYAVGDVALDQFDVPDSAEELWYRVSIRCDPAGLEGDQGFGILEVHPGDEAGAGLSYHHTCPAALDDSGVLDPASGSWGITAVPLGASFDTTWVPRTLQEFRL